MSLSNRLFFLLLPLIATHPFHISAQDSLKTEKSVPAIPSAKEPDTAKTVLNDSLPADSLFDAAALDSVMSPRKKQAKRRKAPNVLGWGGGVSWNVLILPEVDAWMDAISQMAVDTLITGGRHTLERGFEGFNNTFSPAVNLVLHRRSKSRLGLSLEYFSITKRYSYFIDPADTTQPSHQSREELLRVQGLPLIVWFSRPIPKSLFTVKGFEQLHVGAGLYSMPWVKVFAHGNVQDGAWGVSKGIGFLISFAVNKDINEKWYYRSAIQYGSSPLSSFRTDGGNLNNNALNIGRAGDFSLEFGCLQFSLQFVYHKKRVPGQMRKGQKRNYPGSRNPRNR